MLRCSRRRLCRTPSPVMLRQMGYRSPHHVVKGGSFLLDEIERLDHFKEISGSVQNEVQGQKSNVKRDSRSLAPLTSEIFFSHINDAFEESDAVNHPDGPRVLLAIHFHLEFAAAARQGLHSRRSNSRAAAIRSRALGHRIAGLPHRPECSSVPY